MVTEILGVGFCLVEDDVGVVDRRGTGADGFGEATWLRGEGWAGARCPAPDTFLLPPCVLLVESLL